MTRHTIHMSRRMVTHMGVMQACLRRLGRSAALPGGLRVLRELLGCL